LAELLQAPVIDRLTRLNFPNRHPLCHTLGAGAAIRQADVILTLEPENPFAIVNSIGDVVDAHVESRTKPGAKVINIGTGNTWLTKSNFNTFMRYSPADLVIPGDGEATLPSLIEAIATELQGSAKTRAEARGKKLTETSARLLEAARRAAAAGWDASPI